MASSAVPTDYSTKITSIISSLNPAPVAACRIQMKELTPYTMRSITYH